MRPEVFTQLVETIHRLRAPGGCPWDREQTFHSLRQFMVEEAHEAVDVMDRIDTPEKLKEANTRDAFREELGDVLLQVVLNAEMTRELGAFDIYDVAEALNAKMIHRHPHVFGDQKLGTSEQVLQNWEKRKAAEKGAKDSVLDGVPRNLPALQRAARTIEKVTRVGFQWPDLTGPIAKAEEELAELKVELEKLQAATSDDEKAKLKAKVEDELGDALFTLANLAYLVRINPEDALRKQLTRFDRRFRHVEKRVKEQGKKLEEVDLAEMDGYWNEAKAQEKAGG